MITVIYYIILIISNLDNRILKYVFLKINVWTVFYEKLCIYIHIYSKLLIIKINGIHKTYN